MSTDSQNPRYSYLTLNRSIVGTGSFSLDVAGSTIYRLDTNTSTVQVQFNNSGNDQIPLTSKRRVDVGSNGFTKIIISWTAIAVAETLILLIADSEASSTDIGVEISDYSTSIAGGITITGTPDVNIAEINSSTTGASNFEEVVASTSTLGTRQSGYGIINQNPVATTAYTVPVGTVSYLHSIYTMCSQSVAGGGLAYFYLYSSGGAILTSLSTCQLITTVGNRETATFTYATPIKMVAGETLRVVSNANMFQNWGYYLTEVT